MILFKNGKVRLMGAKLRDIDHAKEMLNCAFPQYECDYICYQTHTVVGSLGMRKINLLKMSYKFPTVVTYEWELFPAVKLSLHPHIMVNLFHTGKLVCMGKRACDYALLDSIRKHLYDMACISNAM